MRTHSSLLRISIVTPSYNQGRFIEQTIRSVLKQEYPNLEYIVIDGGSTDNTVSILKKYSDKLQWISEPDSGQSNAINKGLKRATGDILCYLNSDDLLLPGSLENINQYFIHNPERLWVTGYCRIINEQGTVISDFSTRYKNFWLRHFRPATLLMINYISQMSTFWRREAMDQVGFFSERKHLTMDYDYWLRLLQYSSPGILRTDLSCFRLHHDSKSAQRFRAQFRESYATAVPYIRTPGLKILSWLHNWLVILMYSIQSRQKA